MQRSRAYGAATGLSHPTLRYHPKLRNPQGTVTSLRWVLVQSISIYDSEYYIMHKNLKVTFEIPGPPFIDSWILSFVSRNRF